MFRSFGMHDERFAELSAVFNRRIATGFNKSSFGKEGGERTFSAEARIYLWLPVSGHSSENLPTDC